jgi:hypothetical protein
MHLLRIELENFKSFGGQITVPFDQGFTAILLHRFRRYPTSLRSNRAPPFISYG